MKRQLVVCDRDERYRQMIQSYLTKRLRDFEVLVFADLKQAAEYSRRQTFALLLVSESLYETNLQGVQADQFFILREKGERAVGDIPYIEKYKSMECLIRDILDGYSEERQSLLYAKRNGARIHAFYSPVGQWEQTKASLALGQVLTQTGKKVLYLNLQPFAGFEELLQKSVTSDITDFLYFMRRQDKNLRYRMQGMTQTIGGMDYLPAARDSMDLLTITQQEWMTLLDNITETSEYQELILNLSEVCQGLYRMLERSEEIYSMAGNTEVEQGAVCQYKRLLEKRELSGILEKTKWLELPQGYEERAMNMERLAGTRIGEYMKGWIAYDSRQI